MPNIDPKHNQKRDPSVIIDELLAIKGPGNASLIDFFKIARFGGILLGDAANIRFERKWPLANTAVEFLEQCAKDKDAIVQNPQALEAAITHTMGAIEIVWKKTKSVSGGMRALGYAAMEAPEVFDEMAIDIGALDLGEELKNLDAEPAHLPDNEPIPIEMRIPTTARGQRREDARTNHASEQYTAMLGDAYAKLYELSKSLNIPLPTRFKSRLGGELEM